VINAVKGQELGSEVYESYLKLVKEQRRFQIGVEEKKRQGKLSGKMSREANNFRKKFKY
jgi:ribosome biogenesis GTPase